jgi:hypothetical protein
MTTPAATGRPLGYAEASTQRVIADNAIEYAYRDTGDSAVPLVLLQHFRGNLDNWDPALVDERGPAGRRAHLRQDDEPRRADDVADPSGAVRRCLRMGSPQPRAARASRRRRSPGVRRQRRQRPDDPPSLLIPPGGAITERARHDLPRLGARLSLPAPQPVRRGRARLSRGARLKQVGRMRRAQTGAHR